MSRPRRFRHLAVNLLLALASFLFLSAALEVGARLLGLPKGSFILFTGCVQRSALFGFEQKPNCRLEDKRGQAWFHSNSLGQRGDEVRDDGSLRVLAVGDSSTWGWGKITNGETYPARLQALLDQRHGANRYQVINTGVPGWTSFQGLVYLRERGIPLHPAIVIIGFGFNDALQTGDDEERTKRHAALLPLMRLDDYLLGHSIFYSWFRWQIHSATAKGLPHRVAPEKYRANLSEMVRLARASGAEVVLLSLAQPTQDQIAHLKVLEEVGRDLHVPIVAYEGPRLDPVHPTLQGYQMLAEALLARMDAQGFLKLQAEHGG